MYSVFDRISQEAAAQPVRDRLAGLVRRIEAIECRHRPEQPSAGSLCLGWAAPRLRHGNDQRPPAPGPDHVRWGCLHEWLCDGGAEDGATAVLLHIARRALNQHAGQWDGAARADERMDGAAARPVVWIGRRRRAYPPALAAVLPLVVWVQASDERARLWSIDLALRCRGVSVVIADGGGLGMAASRRLQLAAEEGGTLGLLHRPASERATLSVAATRWQVTPAPSPTARPRWNVELLRCKGAQPDRDAPRCFMVEWDHVQGDLVVPDQLADRPGAAAGAAQRVRAAG